MASKANTGGSVGTETEDEIDYSIYPHVEGIRTSTNWRLGSYGERGVLSSAMIADLSDRFQLPETVVRNMSVYLGHCLNNDDDIAINLTEIKRSQAIDRGQTALRSLHRQAKHGTLSPHALKVALSPLSPYFAKTPEDAELLPSLIEKLDGVTIITPDMITTIQKILETPGAAAEMSPKDKRKSRDKRRQYIIETCCYAWKDTSRPLTYTTYADGRTDGQRHGPLIEFIQAVVAMITQPSQKLSGETIRVDIDHFRKTLMREEKELWAPPETSNQYT